MYVYATAFKVQVSDDVGAAEQMWSYAVAIGHNADHTDWEYGPEADFASYFLGSVALSRWDSAKEAQRDMAFGACSWTSTAS